MICTTETAESCCQGCPKLQAFGFFTIRIKYIYPSGKGMCRKCANELEMDGFGGKFTSRSVVKSGRTRCVNKSLAYGFTQFAKACTHSCVDLKCFTLNFTVVTICMEGKLQQNLIAMSGKRYQFCVWDGEIVFVWPSWKLQTCVENPNILAWNKTFTCRMNFQVGRWSLTFQKWWRVSLLCLSTRWCVRSKSL